jgi:hypothetical protein
MAKKAADDSVANQVFIGCPWKTVRPKYERIIDRLNRKYPLSFIIVGRRDGQQAEELLTVIKQRLGTSASAIFDATYGNANVSLEFGFAEAADIPRAIYISSHAASRRNSKDGAIISDLAGKKHNPYKQERGLAQLLAEFARTHNYTKRFESFMQRKFRRGKPGAKKRARALALKIIHQLDGEATVRRTDIVQAMQADASHYSGADTDRMIVALHQAGLIQSVQGPHSKVWIK